MAIFPLLADVAGYRACDTDLLLDHAARAYWLQLFRAHFTVQLAAARSVGAGQQQCDEAMGEWHAELDAIGRAPDRHGRLDILKLDELRQQVLSAHGIVDEFRLIKQRENAAALTELPAWMARIAATPDAKRLEAIVSGLLAGNLFDMGVKETAGRFARGSVSFSDLLARVPKRPWLFDDVEVAANRLGEIRPRNVLIFADNAGGDLVLGVLPLAREFLRRGASVTITANEQPSLNDITHAELAGLIIQAGEIEPVFLHPMLRMVSSGNAAPLIDLARVSDALADAARGVDLVILVGMGRGIESNWTARMTCDTWRVAMIKDPQVARTVGGSLYDAVFRFDPANTIRS